MISQAIDHDMGPTDARDFRSRLRGSLPSGELPPWASIRWLRITVFYFLFPLILNVGVALRGPDHAPNFCLAERLILFLPSSIVIWGAAGIGAALLAQLTRSKSLPITVLLAIGGSAISLITYHYALGLWLFFLQDRWPWFATFLIDQRPMLRDDVWAIFRTPLAITQCAQFAIATILYHWIVPEARYYGGAPVKIGTNCVAAPMPIPGDRSSLLKKLPSKLGTDIIMMAAEEHYVMVSTTLGSAMILYRFADAIEDVCGLDGDRVHRSYWIAWPHVVSIDRAGRGRTLIMSSGARVPVSRSHNARVERRRGLGAVAASA